MPHIEDIPEHETSRTVFAWYDGREPRLTEAFKHLATLRQKPKRRLRHKFTFPTTLTLICIGLSISTEFARTDLLLFVVGALIGASPWLEIWWKHQVYSQEADRLELRIRQGEFGNGVMWNDDLLWELLDAALKTHNLSLADDILSHAEFEQYTTPLLARLVSETQAHCKELRENFASDGLAIEALRMLTATAASVIAQSLNLWQTRPRE